MSRIGIRGFSDANGFWYTSCTLRRNCRRASPRSRGTSCPATATVPASAVSKPTRMRAVVDLPEPDSPTIAWVVPAATANETSSTAVTVDEERRNSLRSPST